jgi:uncharacterized protein YdeI (YjbR/CyaY-like superfamily)
MRVKFFAKASEFRKWLSSNHDKADELWVGYYKKVTGIPSITYPESVDEALCYGWIDGLRQSIDEKSYRIRFTPRRAGSTWSDVNIRRVKKLTELGKMEPAGTRAFESRKMDSASNSVKRENIRLSRQFEDRLKSNEKAWEYFNGLAPSFRKISIGWIMSAKKEETRLRRLAVLIESSEKGRLVPPLIVSRKKRS